MCLMIGKELGKSLSEIYALPVEEFYYWHEFLLMEAEEKRKAAKKAAKK